MSIQHDSTPLDHWRILQCRLIRAYERSFPKTRKRWAYVPLPEAVWLLKKGTVTLEFESGNEHYSAGYWIFPKNASGIQEFSEDAKILSLRFHAEWSSGLALFDRLSSVQVKVESAPELLRDANALVRAVNTLLPANRTQSISLTGDLLSYLTIQPLLLKCVASYFSTLSANGGIPNIPGILDERIREALHYLDTWPLDTVVHERHLAARIGLSVSQLNRLFVRDLRTTPAAVWNRRKLLSACSQLGQNSFSIKQIAISLGFSAPEHFSNWFRKHTNVSPREYRQTHQV